MALWKQGRTNPFTENSLFHAGSIAKPVPAAAALALVERGLLALDEDVNIKLASWQVPENEFTIEEKVTLRRLLSHSSGLTDGFPMRSSSDREYDWELVSEGESPSLTIQEVLEAQPPADEGRPTRVTQVPGTAYRYSILGYGMLELLMLDVTGERFPDLMRETLLGPLGMSSSTFEQPLPEELRYSATTEHYVSGRPFEGKRHHWPYRASGGLWTTPSTWRALPSRSSALMQGDSDLLLSQEMVSEALTAQYATGESGISNSYGLGLHLGGSGREQQAIHTGGTWGSTCLLYFLPGYRAGGGHHDQLCPWHRGYPL